MQKQFYRSRNMPIEHPMILTGPDPPASVHQLSPLPNIEKLINKQISSHYQTKSKQISYQKNLSTSMKHSQQILTQLQRAQEKLVRNEKKHEEALKQKDTKLFMTCLQIERLSKINKQILKESDQLHHSHTTLNNHFNNQLKKYKSQLLKKSQGQLRLLKQQFDDCVGEMKFKYSQRLAMMVGKEAEENTKLNEYKEIIKIMEMENELNKKQRQSQEEELKQVREQMKQKIRVLQSEANKRREQNMELVLKNSQLEVGKKLLEEKYQKIMKLNATFQQSHEKEEIKSRVVRFYESPAVEKHQSDRFGHHQNKKSAMKQKHPHNSKSQSRSQHQSQGYSRSISQSEYSHRYTHYQQQLTLKNHEINELTKQVQYLNKILSQKQSHLNQQIKRLQQSSIDLNLHINKLQTEKSALEQKNIKLTNLLGGMRRASELAIDDQQNIAKSYKLRLQQSENQLMNLKQTQHNLMVELEEYRHKNKEYMDILDLKSSRQISLDIDQMRRDNEDLLFQVESLRRELQEKQLEIQRLNEIFDNGEVEFSKEEPFQNSKEDGNNDENSHQQNQQHNDGDDNNEQQTQDQSNDKDIL